MEFEPEYRSKPMLSIADQFLVPALSTATRYYRETGYFSTSALVSWVASLERLISGEFEKVKLIGSPNLSASDIEMFKSLTSHEKLEEILQNGVDEIIKKVIALTETNGSQQVSAELFSWLYASERIEIKFALWMPNNAQGIELENLYHKKSGLIFFENDSSVAFTGSMNETYSGHVVNYEEIDVYRSWEPSEINRIKRKLNHFELSWMGEIEGLKVCSPSQDLCDQLRVIADKRARSSINNQRKTKLLPDKWRHQIEAKNWFLNKRVGLLEMATGTGKTRTALSIAKELVVNNKVSTIIIAMDGTDLLNQWHEDVIEWKKELSQIFPVFRMYKNYKNLDEFLFHTENSIILISREFLPRLLHRISEAEAKNSIIIHDEAHGVGAPTYIQKFANHHDKFKWRLGLSATPERAFDDKGNAFIKEVFGGESFRFDIKDAIERGVLCPFEYRVLEYTPTANDKERIKGIQALKALRDKQGDPMPNEELYRLIAAVYKTAEEKPKVFSEYLAEHPEELKNSIVFVETMEQAQEFMPILQKHCDRYHTYFADDHVHNLEAFSRGEFDTLITCHKISQGIDIRRLEKVFIVSSAAAQLETIQRIGRCLRSDPENPHKIAKVIDFVRPQSDSDQQLNSDQKRKEWLSKLAKVRPGNG